MKGYESLGMPKNVCKGARFPVERGRCVVSRSSLFQRLGLNAEEEGSGGGVGIDALPGGDARGGVGVRIPFYR